MVVHSFDPSRGSVSKAGLIYTDGLSRDPLANTQTHNVQTSTGKAHELRETKGTAVHLAGTIRALTRSTGIPAGRILHTRTLEKNERKKKTY